MDDEFISALPLPSRTCFRQNKRQRSLEKVISGLREGLECMDEEEVRDMSNEDLMQFTAWVDANKDTSRGDIGVSHLGGRDERG